ncbi:uncharacterized protein LOC110019351 [Phalaenopsis equestris]|uniref:uncharacterized protein LOC110019351 n=1 Tax=Phalaenopsis equestris TaxID=78828 RepID=UPI0009E3E321|nr:uncharacterized protein LOC110019351 [Phalaenopsis equestris]
MESTPSPTITKRLCHIFRLLYYMLRNSISKRKLMMDLHLLLKRGKLAGKLLSKFISFHHNGGAALEFSCNNTPFYPSARRNKRGRRKVEFDSFDEAMMAKAFEVLSTEVSDMESVISSTTLTPSPSPSPAAMWWLGRSPAWVRQLRVTDSPFVGSEEVVEEGKVDKEAEDFIRWFHEQLRRQQLESVGATPERFQSRARLSLNGGQVRSNVEGWN